ncbi:MAG: hypothetical protein GWO86_00935 [Planctomycetes bacterium]|nr:hypothetical protein [Planctomycetota bacterium]
METQTLLTKARVVKICLLLFFLVVSPAVAVSRSDFVGAWMNDDPATGGITRILVKTSGTSDLEVNAFGKCVPMDCDWGFASAAFSGNPFVVVYTSGHAVVTLTMDLLTPTTMYVKAFHDYPPGDPRSDRTDEYDFHLMTNPDFVIREVTQPIGFLKYGIYNWIEFSIQNLGAPYTSLNPLQAKIVNKEKNGQPVSASGYMAPSYTLPIETGQKISHKFAIGHDSSWADGDYTFNIMADYDNLITEEVETNNLSRRVTVTIMEDYQLTGFCKFNNQPMSLFTSETPWSQLQNSGGLIPGAEFRYYPVTGRYAVNNVPTSGSISLNAGYLTASSIHNHYPGNYVQGSVFDLSTMTPEDINNHDLDFQYVIHMTEPWDNTEILSFSDPMPEHQPGIKFQWDSVSGANEYLFAVDRYRSSSHPSGPGRIDRPVEIYASETEQVVSLPVSDPNEYYTALITAKNASGQTIGRMYRPMLDGYGFNYPFTVDYECYSLPKLKMFISKRSTIDISGTLWYSHKITVTNLDVVPDELFVPAPDLAACGSNTEASRTYVEFYDENDSLLNSYCAVYDKNTLNDLSFSIRQSDPLPKAVKMVLEDRRCATTHESIYVDPWYACPVGDLNGDCVANFMDLYWMASTWLSQEDLL